MHGAPRAPRDRRYSTNLWRRVREQVRARDGGICRACGRKQPPDGRRLFPVDHRNPGGDFYDPDNLWLLCWSCNTSKSGATVEEWHRRAEPRVPAQSSRVVPYNGRPLLVGVTSAEANAARELGRIRASVEAHLSADHGTWPIVGAAPTDHGHSPWAPRCTFRLADGVTWDVCPPGCERPMRWRAA